MRIVFALVLLVGLGLSGFAVYMARDYITAVEAQQVQVVSVPTRDIYVVNRATRYGDRLTADDVRLVSFPEAALPEGAFHTADALFPKGPDVTRAVLRAMEPNEAVLASKVTAPGEDAGVSARLGEGMRAFAINVDVSSGVSGFLRPGDRVDVYWSGTMPDDRNVTKLIDTNVRLVAIDQSADEDRNEAVVARTVTVEATPRDVAALAQAQNTGRLSLSLVGANDLSVAQGIEVDQRDLLGIVDEVQVAVEAPRVCTIRTRRGADVVEIPVPCTN
ncbi:CpaB family protein [Oceaniovalibus guishaninsula JLT2003]|uniref:CpaB family protein n=1 Tax=Oceaniovalibus guishaninsula JLT2003 TaxID=1231392 RepID=K2GP07_9RHOB|nr:Flp pilus assembly protein CpaB [Oceaniovalibus guishaninsula]EKE44426.1 CpaB family protein [Oceaniovalibus guishaninsula JLT2003]